MNVLNSNEKDWLEDAVPMDKALSSSKKLRQLVDALFEEIAPLIKVSSKSRQKEALKTTLMNLICAHQLDKPVRYSRDKNCYTRDRRYGKLYFKYDRLIPIIDTMEGLGYIKQSSFYFDHEKKRRRTTNSHVGHRQTLVTLSEIPTISSLPSGP